MNRQEIFNIVRDHLLNQGKKANTKNNVHDGGCYYLDDNGNKCAIGCLIPDGHPAQKSGGYLYELLVVYPDLSESWGVESADDRKFLSNIQAIHDDNQPEVWKDTLTEFAIERDLIP